MTERMSGYGERWKGVVVNVNDPKKQGRVQVRVFHLHDDTIKIPDKDLPWAIPRVPITEGASLRGVSTSPVGVVPGTIVDGYFEDADRTVLIVTGTLQSAGTTVPGSTVNGSFAIDSRGNDMANAARGQDLNAALGLRNLPAIAQVGAVAASLSAGVGTSAERTAKILNVLQINDPLNMSGSMANSVARLNQTIAINQIQRAAALFPGGFSALSAVFGVAASKGIPTAILASPAGALLSGIPNISSLIASMSNSGFISNLAFAVTANVPALSAAAQNIAISTVKRQFASGASAPILPPIPPIPSFTSSKATTTVAALIPPVASVSNTALTPIINDVKENYDIMSQITSVA